MAFCSIGQYLHDIPPSEYSAYIYSTLRVTSHEIGHCYGLVHCSDENCGMQASKSGLDAVKEKINFCNKCLKKLSSVSKIRSKKFKQRSENLKIQLSSLRLNNRYLLESIEQYEKYSK